VQLGSVDAERQARNLGCNLVMSRQLGWVHAVSALFSDATDSTSGARHRLVGVYRRSLHSVFLGEATGSKLAWRWHERHVRHCGRGL
jgi:hypothetical protein